MRDDGLNASAVAWAAGCKEAAASWFFITAVAFGQKIIFPVRNRLCCIRPDRTSQNAARKVVNRRTNLARRQNLHRFGEPVLIIDGIYPKKSELGQAGRQCNWLMTYEYSIGAKWLQLLKEIAPRITRAVVSKGAWWLLNITHRPAFRST